MIYDDYIEYCKEYEEKYGEKTVVFMQVGDFFELYAVQSETERAGADIYRVAELCNIQVSRKNKSILENSRQNPLMAGFPIATISKFIQTMLQYNYTCVLIRQTTPPPNPKREVTEVISPATTLTIQSSADSYLMVVYWECITDYATQKKYLSIGCGLIDITTGKSYVYEANSTNSDPNYAMDEVYRLFCHYKPSELVFLGEIDPSTIDQLEQTYRNTALHTCWNSKQFNVYKQVSYQNTVLEKIFGKTLISPIEVLQLEKSPFATIAYTYMIQFAYEHNESIVQKIEKPVHLTNKTHLILEANCAYQLNLLSYQNEQTLYDILNQTKTAFGSRLFKERLLNPIISITELENRYDEVDYFKNYYQTLTPLLASILDLERIIRKIGLVKLQPCEWVSLHVSLEMAVKIYTVLDKPTTSLSEVMQEYQSILNLEECAKYNLQDIYTSLFKKGFAPELDACYSELQEHFAGLEEIARSLDPTLCKIDCNDRDGYFITTTKKRWDTIKQEQYTAKPISSTSSVLRITSKAIEKRSDQILLLQRKLSIMNINRYKEYLVSFYDKFHTLFQKIIQDLAIIDVGCTNAKNAVDYNYKRPKLVSQEHSYITANNLRHPIIERLSLQSGYVTNDIHLNHSGMLLYGINASGKSSLMKSIGLAVIMAQAGMYTAGTVELAPYSRLFTRITTMDNIWRGLSTFTVEMLELKNILNRCDKRSLVLGDELCAGTEAVSGIAIVAAGIKELQRKEVSFVFATHLHELLEVELVKSTDIQVLHMHIEVDADGRIIYDRKLKPGSGSPLYGLEVCKFLQMPDTFLKTANEVRKKIQKIPSQLVPQKQSRYNKDLYVGNCEVCGKPATETHHIKHQKDATDMFVHHSSNLVPLCEECHLQQHTGETIIEGKIHTSAGTQLQVLEKKAPEEKRKTVEELQKVLIYQIKGWYYRLKPTEKWKKVTTNSLQKLHKLGYPVPLETDAIEVFLREQQSHYMHPLT